jgi:PAS domain S-box-containing protein
MKTKSYSHHSDTIQIHSFLADGGEMGELTRNFDWTNSSIGSPGRWPQSLQTTLSILLNSSYPMFLWWGEDLIQFYNDAYRPSLGNNGKHPHALGQKGEDCWPEIWTVIKPLIDQVRSGAGATWSEDQLIPIYRNGKMEDVYWTFGYSPVKDESGNVGGVLVVCNETTEKILNLKKLEESNNQLEFAIEATQLGTWDLDPSTHTFNGNNKRLNEWFGLAEESKIELSEAIKVVADKDRDRVSKAIHHAMEFSSGGQYEIEYSIIHPVTHRERIVKAKGRAWFNEHQVAYRFNGTLQDVTEQAIARKRIEESEKNLRSMILQAPVAMCILKGPVHTVEIANERMLALWGIEEAIGKPIFEFLPDAKNEGFEELLNGVYYTGQSYNAFGVPVTLFRTNGWTTVYIDFLYYPFKEADGRISGIMAVATEVTEQVIARKKIEESAQQIRDLVESAPLPIGVYVGKEMRIQFANQTILDIWGKGNDVIGKLYTEVLPELENQKIFEQLEGVFTTGTPFHAMNRHIDLIVNGIKRPYYFNYSFTPLRDAEGQVYGVMNTAADVTDLNLAKKKIEDSELFARTIIQKSSAAQIIWLGEDMIFSMVNERMLEILGRDLSIIGKPFLEAIPELIGTPLMGRLRNVLHTGETYYQPEELFVLNRHGIPHTGYYNYTFQALSNAAGENYGIICTAIEVTDQVRAKKILEEEKERTRLAIEAGELGVFEIDLKTNEIITDMRFNQIMGFDKNVSWDEYTKAFHPDDLPLRAMPLDQLRTGMFDFEARVIHNDKSIHWIRKKGSVYMDLNGHPANIIGVLQDITERKQVEESMEFKNTQLIRTNNDLDNFIYTASHDLKSPMSNIEGLLNTLKDSILSEQGKMSADTDMIFQLMEKSINRFKTTILDLTEITKAQKAEDEDINELNFSQILEDVKLSIYDKIAESRATIITDFSGANTIKFSKKNLRSILYNLLSNAVKYRDKNRPSEIFIKTEKADGFILVQIKDNGLGISKNGREKLFTMFKRFHDHVEGTGIGLYIVKRIMDNAGGKIEVDSEVGAGTTFNLYFKVD